MILELHIIQNFAPSNLNRSDTGAPKDCTFGGFRRARISSQCLKRAIRLDSSFQQVLAECGGSVRTRQLVVEIAKRIASHGITLEHATKVVSEVFKEGGIERPERGEDGEKGNTKLVIFMNQETITKMAETFKANWDDLSDKTKKMEVIDRLAHQLAESVKAPDIALFGRMLEIDSKKAFGKFNLGVLGSTQVAHAISTHKVGIDFDYFTAVDDLLGPGDIGAGMIGTVEFNSACFYRYLNVDVDLLKKNLQGDEELTKSTVEAFIRAAIDAIPTGKQNSFATHEKPSFVLAVISEAGKSSLANAFEKPARATESRSLVTASIEQLASHWESITGVYGDDSKAKYCISTHPAELKNLSSSNVGNLGKLVEDTVNAAFSN